MHDRSALGRADVSDDELATMVADLFSTAPAAVDVLDSRAVEVDYDIPSITTASRHWVRGSAQVDGKPRPFSLFVKHVQSWSRSPFFTEVPLDFRDAAEASVPWRTEALVYRSDLGDHLPTGLRVPQALGVYDLDEKSVAIWLEEVEVATTQWDLRRFEDAARLLGRLAGSATVARYADVGEFDWDITRYVHGRLANQVIPMLHADSVWEHPLVTSTFGPDLRGRLLAAADTVDDLAAELLEAPVATSHGDACPNNLLIRDGDESGFTLIDFGFWHGQPVGFDLGQLLVGDVQLGRRSASDLAERGELCLEAYHAGLADEGYQVDRDVLRRAHALHLLLFSGLSALPFELLEQEPTAELQHLATERAAIARHSLDLLDATR